MCKLYLNILNSKTKTKKKALCRTNEPHLLWTLVRRLLDNF